MKYGGVKVHAIITKQWKAYTARFDLKLSNKQTKKPFKHGV